MLNTTRLIINDSYWSLFDEKKYRTQEFLSPSISEINLEQQTIMQLTRKLALIMKHFDADEKSKYGIEIKTNGSSRSSRIPMVRHTITNQSIWRVVKDIKGIEKGIIELKDLTYYLIQTRTNSGLALPTKVLLLAFPEIAFINNEHGKYVIDKAEESQTIIISIEFIRNVLSSNDIVNFNDLLFNNNSVITTESIQLCQPS